MQAGDLLHFPACDEGAHKLTSTAKEGLLRYLNVDSCAPLDVAFYPDSGKVGLFGDELKQIYRLTDRQDDYDGEE